MMATAAAPGDRRCTPISILSEPEVRTQRTMPISQLLSPLSGRLARTSPTRTVSAWVPDLMSA